MSGSYVQDDVFGTSPPSSPSVRKTPVRAHQRRVKGEPPPSGAELRDRGIARATASKATKIAIDYVRERLLEIYRSRAAGWLRTDDPDLPGVNADDVADVLDAWPGCPAEIREKKTQDWRGAIFRKGWQKTGQVRPSRRRHMHSTDLPSWRPVGPDATS